VGVEPLSTAALLVVGTGDGVTTVGVAALLGQVNQID
jgi:hypothetical protein